jgi:hypothetical protein
VCVCVGQWVGGCGGRVRGGGGGMLRCSVIPDFIIYQKKGC